MSVVLLTTPCLYTSFQTDNTLDNLACPFKIFPLHPAVGVRSTVFLLQGELQGASNYHTQVTKGHLDAQAQIAWWSTHSTPQPAGNSRASQHQQILETPQTCKSA